MRRCSRPFRRLYFSRWGCRSPRRAQEPRALWRRRQTPGRRRGAITLWSSRSLPRANKARFKRWARHTSGRTPQISDAVQCDAMLHLRKCVHAMQCRISEKQAFLDGSELLRGPLPSARRISHVPFLRRLCTGELVDSIELVCACVYAHGGGVLEACFVSKKTGESESMCAHCHAAPNDGISPWCSKCRPRSHSDDR